MFKGTSFYFTEPICFCAEKNIVFGIHSAKDKNGKESFGLWFECKICKTKLMLAPEQWRWEAVFYKPYPGKPKEETPVEEAKEEVKPEEESESKEDPKKKPN